MTLQSWGSDKLVKLERMWGRGLAFLNRRDIPACLLHADGDSSGEGRQLMMERDGAKLQSKP